MRVFAPFADVAIEAGAIVLMDRGNGDKRGHYMTTSCNFEGSTLSRDDVAGAKPKSDSFQIDALLVRLTPPRLARLPPFGPAGRRTRSPT